MIKWPERRGKRRDDGSIQYNHEDLIWNTCRDACIKAYEQAHAEGEGISKEILVTALRSVAVIRINPMVRYLFVDEAEHLADAVLAAIKGGKG